MRTGEILKKNLGLEDFRYIRICRIVLTAHPMYMVFYDSYRKDMPITVHRIMKFPYVAMMFSGTELQWGLERRPQLTPPMDLEQFNGNLRGAYFIPVNLAGDRFIDRKQFSKVIESKGKELYHVMSMNRVKDDDGKLIEFVTLSDLMQDKGVSDLTMRFKQRRSGEYGAESNIAKLIDLELDEEDKSITFKWLTEPTYFEYPEDYDYQEVDTDTKELERNPGKVYELWIKILDFFSWLDTEPDKSEIKSSDMKTIFDVSNVQVWSNDPSFWWQGISYWLTQLDGCIFPNNIAPQRWNAAHLHGDGNAFLNKHMQSLINGIKFWYGPMSQMLTKKLRDNDII